MFQSVAVVPEQSWAATTEVGNGASDGECDAEPEGDGSDQLALQQTWILACNRQLGCPYTQVNMSAVEHRAMGQCKANTNAKAQEKEGPAASGAASKAAGSASGVRVAVAFWAAGPPMRGKLVLDPRAARCMPDAGRCD